MNSTLIAKIHVDSLFGLYTYDLPQEGSLPEATILYAENGLGKSTILQLAFHLLSAANNRGHRTALYQAPFHYLEVQLGDGTTLSAKRSAEKDTASLKLTIQVGGKTLATWDFNPSKKNEQIEFHEMFYAMQQVVGGPKKLPPRPSKSPKEGEKPYIQVLTSHAPTIFILSADRHLSSDSVADPSDEVELRQAMRSEPKSISAAVLRAREIALAQALATTARWISRQAIEGANLGSTNVHSVYIDVLQHLMASPAKHSQAPLPDTNDLVNRLHKIASKSEQYAKYDFTTPLSVHEFEQALQNRSTDKAALLSSLLEPYIRSLESRLKAIEPVYMIVETFVKIVNELFADKTLAYRAGRGFTIANRLGTELTPSQLSSGEQQLLLLLCYVMIARDRPTVFMIDEPEISLNIRWQRRLVQALLEITAGANIQFILASHSMELLAQHRDRVVRLESKT